MTRVAIFWIFLLLTAGDTTLSEFFNDWFYGERLPVYWLISQTAEVVNLQLTENPETIIVFPNPFQNEVSIIMKGNQSILKTRIFNAAGKLLNQFDENQTTLDFSHLPKGIYILKIETLEKTTERKIVKH